MPLGAGGSFETIDALVAGFNAVNFFGVSDQPFEIRILEGCREGGTFAGTETLSSVVSGGLNVLCEQVLPCGRKMIAVFTNLGGPETFLSFCAMGLPEP